ncbi:hypothetical protein [Streptomyces sp. GMY02]|uniref:effector-associated constant component EACC1 n=1 Tax=Streptomyces sp. GMY02 TaxID=1333528 RepID=UPI00349F2A4C
MASLGAWLREERSFPVTLVPGPPTPESLGLTSQIQVTVTSASALTSAILVITDWLRMPRRASVQLTIEGPSDQRVILTAASRDDAVELSRVLTALGGQQRDASIATPDGHTPPGPPLDPDDDWPRETPEQ